MACVLLSAAAGPTVARSPEWRGAGGQQGESSALALVGAKVYTSPADEPIPDGTVLIRDGKVVAVGRRDTVRLPPGAITLDCAGLTVTAGFWNSHVHLIERKWAQASSIPPGELALQLQRMLTRHGFTTVVDTGSVLENTRAIRQRIESGDVPGPAILSSGEVLLPRGGRFSADFMQALGFMPLPFPEVDGADEARRAARQKLDEGVDAVKIYTGTWSGPSVVMPTTAVLAIVEEAHRRSRPVLAHPSNASGLRSAIDGGVDVLVHTAPSVAERSLGLFEEANRMKIALIPTLKLWRHETRHDRAVVGELLTRAGVEQLRAFHGAGGTVLFGTDVGYMDDDDPAEELVLMTQAGMDHRQILTSLTTAPATRFGQGKSKGELRPGMDADVVVLSGDPADDVRCLSRVRYTIRSGRVVFRAQ